MKDFDRLFLGFGKLCQDFDSLCQDCVTLFGARWILNNFASEDQLIIGNGANQRNEKFTVNISFGGVAENIEIPFAAITSFLDPVANFGFQFALKKHSDHSQNHHITKADVLPSEIKFAESKKNVTTKEAEVISLYTFREKRDEKNKT